jgi:hypothetical protein
MNGATIEKGRESSTTPSPSLKRRGASYAKGPFPSGKLSSPMYIILGLTNTSTISPQSFQPSNVERAPEREILWVI